MAAEIAARDARGEPADCDVIVPVHNGHDELRRCLASLARHTPARHRILLVDDASTDARIPGLLREFAAGRMGVEVLESERNLGFPGAVNLAIARTPGDVVVVNSDTEVTEGWLDSLIRCRRSDRAIGIACPLSNRATILSVEGITQLLHRGDGSADVDAIGRCVRAAGTRGYTRLPTAVGFCMLLTRELIDRVGSFDPVYGRGYGEENDLSMRALDAGFDIACCDDAYVHHAGEASFGAVSHVEGERERNRVRLERRWPAYAPGIAAWARGNPLRRAIERANAAAERAAHPGKPRVLQVLHRFDSRGGIEEHTRAVMHELRGEAVFNVAVPHHAADIWGDARVERLAPHLRIARLNPALMSADLHVIGHPANVEDAAIEAAFRNLLAGGYDVVHFQSPVGWNTLRLPRLARAAGARVVIGMHDLAWMCADYNMMTGPDDRPCGRDAAHGADPGCGPCLKGKSEAVAGRPPISITGYIDQRFEAAADAIDAADVIACPSAYMASRVERAFGARCAGKLRVIAHGVRDFAPLEAQGGAAPMLRVAFLGRFSERKGAQHLIAAARRLAGQRVVFEAWGLMDERLDAAARASGILLRGLYEAADLPRMLRGIDLVVIPSVVEESFCLTLSEAQRLGIPVAASRVGALPERVREGETGFLFESGDAEGLARLLLRLRDDRQALGRVAARLREERPRTLSENAAEYLALYRELAARGETPELDEAESAAFTRACMGFPRTRHTTPLGDGDYDEWLRNPRRPCVVPSPDVPAIHAVILPGAGENGESRTRASLASQSLAPSAVTAAPGGAVEAVRALNRAIAAAGEWIAFVQAGDTIETDALAAIAAGIAANPRAALIYCDDDAVSARGERYDPVFKPRFSPELLRHSPYIAGLCAVRAAALRDRGGLRAIGWSGVVDFALRLAEEHEPGAVVALRELLVHRHDANLGDLQDEAGAPEHLEIVRQHLKRGGARPLFMPAAPGAPPMWAHAPASTLPVTLFLRAAHAPERAAACLGELLQRSGHRIGEVFADLAPAQCNEVSAALAPMGIRVAVVPALDENRPALAYALRRARHEWVAVVDAQCANFRAGWLERLEQGVADRYTAAIAPDLQSPLGARVPGWEVLGAGPWAVCGAPAALRGASALDALYALPREVSVVSNRVALLRRASAIESGALDELSAAGRFDMAHLGLALGALGHDLLSRPFIAADYLGPSDAVQAARVFAGGAGVPEADWMRARWGSQLEDDKRFHPAIALGGERLAAAPGFPPRANMASRAPRICAFPFDRWGTGEIRVRQPCAALDRAGRASVRFMPEHDTGRAPNRLEWRRLDPDVLYAHNFLHDYQLFALEEYARHSKVLKVVGFDDLLTVLPEYNPYAATIYPDIAQRIARAVERSDRVIVTTAALAEAYGRGREVRIIPNAIDEARWAGLANRPRGGSRPRIGWAGARQHFGDLQLLEPVVKATCAEVDWVFFGMCPAALRAMAAEVHEMVPVSRYPGHLASLGLDVAVAPLLDIPFNRAKSNLKLLEYGILGIPVIASDVEPYRGSRAILVRPDPDSWADAVLALARDRDYARRVGMAMQEWVRQQGLLSQTLDDWSRALDPAG